MNQITRFKHEAPVAFGSNSELEAIVERMKALIPVELNDWQSGQANIVRSLDNAYIKAAQLCTFYRLIPGVDVHLLQFGNAFVVDSGVEAWKKAADRYCARAGITYHPYFVDMTPEQCKEAIGQNYTPQDRGAICYIWRSDKAQMYEIFGGSTPEGKMAVMTNAQGFWREKAKFDSNKREWKSDQIPAQRTPQDVARRRALKAALKMEFSLDSLLASAPNEIREQLTYISQDAQRKMEASQPIQREKYITPEGYEVSKEVSEASWREADQPRDESGFRHVGEPLEDDYDPEDNHPSSDSYYQAPPGSYGEDIEDWEEGDHYNGSDDVPPHVQAEITDDPWDDTESQSVADELYAELRANASRLTGKALTLLEWAKEKNAESQGEAGLVDYRILSGEIDALIGKGNHNLLLGTLLGFPVNSQTRPGEKMVRLLLQMIRPQRDKVGEDRRPIMEAKGKRQVKVKEPNPYFNQGMRDAIVITWEQITHEDGS